MRSSNAPALFESVHARGELLRYHGHRSAFATIVLEGAYTEVCNDIPSVCPIGTIVVHDSAEQHADYFTTAGRRRNVESSTHLDTFYKPRRSPATFAPPSTTSSEHTFCASRTACSIEASSACSAS